MHVSTATLAKLLLLLPFAAAALVWLPTLRDIRGRDRSPQGSARAPDRFQDYITTGTSVVSTALTLVLAATATTHRPKPFHVLFVGMYVDALSIYFLLLVSLVAMVSSFYIGPYLTRHHPGKPARQALFYSLFNLFHLTMVLVPMVSNLVILWIGIELTTVTSTALIVVENTRRHFEAAWKYIIITSTGIIFALLGTLFLAIAIRSPSTHSVPGHPSMDWPLLLPIAGAFSQPLVRLSFLFILIGYGTKAGLAPMHTWLPDAHGEAAYPVSALLSGVLLKSALYVILRFISITNASLGGTSFTSDVMLLAGLTSLIFATPLILRRSRFKRTLAYHSLEHMGIISVGIGIGGPIAIFGALLHVLNHGVTKSLMFLAYGNVQDQYSSRGATVVAEGDSGPTAEEEYTGVIRAMPATGWMLALGGLALVGSPPFSTFLSEFIILWGGFHRLIYTPDAWLTLSIVIFVISLVLIFAGLVRHLGRLLLGGPDIRPEPEPARRIAPLVLLLILVVLLGLTVPAIGPFNLRGLLSHSVSIVCGRFCQ
jgi:hydrogenase-4 component F